MSKKMCWGVCDDHVWHIVGHGKAICGDYYLPICRYVYDSPHANASYSICLECRLAEDSLSKPTDAAAIECPRSAMDAQ